MFVEIGEKFIESYSEIKKKNLYCLLHRNVADDFLFQEHFTDLDYLDSFSRYKRSCEPRYL